MEGRRYSEGGVAPALVFPDRSNAYSDQEKLRIRRRNKWIIPIEPTSTTSIAKDCFVGRKNSKYYQQFMLNYAYHIVKSKVLSGEI